MLRLCRSRYDHQGTRQNIQAYVNAQKTIHCSLGIVSAVRGKAASSFTLSNANWSCGWRMSVVAGAQTQSIYQLLVTTCSRKVFIICCTGLYIVNILEQPALRDARAFNKFKPAWNPRSTCGSFYYLDNDLPCLECLEGKTFQMSCLVGLSLPLLDEHHFAISFSRKIVHFFV
jgi:hypothetical protein